MRVTAKYGPAVTAALRKLEAAVSCGDGEKAHADADAADLVQLLERVEINSPVTAPGITESAANPRKRSTSPICRRYALTGPPYLGARRLRDICQSGR